jgi:hypothetical protein
VLMNARNNKVFTSAFFQILTSSLFTIFFQFDSTLCTNIRSLRSVGILPKNQLFVFTQRENNVAPLNDSVPFGLTYKNSAFCSQSAFMGLL